MAKFYSPSGEDVFVSNTVGHTAIITAEPTEIHDSLVREAAMAGCLPDGAKAASANGQVAFNQAGRVVEVMKDMLDKDDPTLFNGDGKPNKMKLDKLCGFSTTREEYESAWAELTKDA